jgi:hypothetical protein
MCCETLQVLESIVLRQNSAICCFSINVFSNGASVVLKEQEIDQIRVNRELLSTRRVRSRTFDEIFCSQVEVIGSTGCSYIGC